MRLLSVPTPKKRRSNPSDMASNIMNVMHVYFQSDKRTMKDLEHSIINSVTKYFEKQPPPEEAA